MSQVYYDEYINLKNKVSTNVDMADFIIFGVPITNCNELKNAVEKFKAKMKDFNFVDKPGRIKESKIEELFTRKIKNILRNAQKLEKSACIQSSMQKVNIFAKPIQLNNPITEDYINKFSNNISNINAYKDFMVMLKNFQKLDIDDSHRLNLHDVYNALNSNDIAIMYFMLKSKEQTTNTSKKQPVKQQNRNRRNKFIGHNNNCNCIDCNCDNSIFSIVREDPH